MTKPTLGKRMACYAFAALLALTSFAASGAELTFDIRIVERRVVEPAGEVLRVAHGDIVVLRVSGDESGELHLHGYDIPIPVGTGAPAEVRFAAVATGRFPLTSHGFGDHAGSEHSHGALLYVEVHPE